MRILGIDYGQKRFGLAITEGEIARPLKVEARNKNLESRIQEICEKENVEKIVIGLPEGRLANEIKDFGQQLESITNIPVEFFDETLTTQDAIKKMIEAGTSKKKRKNFQDAVSAALILQAYLSS